MIFASREKRGNRAFPQAQVERPKSLGRCLVKPPGALAVIAMLVLALTALPGCSSEPSSFGQYFKGRTLHVSVVSLERVPELRYSTIDPNQVIRRWSLSPSAPGAELVLARLKVENHTAVSAIVNVDRSAAELRDFANTSYRPLSTERVWQDFRGESEALVRVDLGQCFDGTRALIDPGTAVRWQSEAEAGQYVAFEDESIAVGPEGRAELVPGGSVYHTFGQPGNYPYVCGGPEFSEWPAEIQVASPGQESGVAARSVQFLQGSFELQRGHGLDGYIVFEAPVGTEFRDMRWRAGDSITIRF